VWDSNYKAVYHMANNAANVSVTDSTANGYNGAAVVNTNTKQTAGEIDGALTFNGSSDNVTSSSFQGPADNITLEAWVQPSVVPGTQRVILEGGSSVDFYLRLEISASNHFRTYFGNNGWGSTEGTDSTASVTTSWTHLVGVHDHTANRTSLYVNGTLDINASDAIDPLSSPGLIIGAFTSSGYNFPGVIDEVRVSGTVRSSDWIAAEYHNQNSPGTFYSLGSESGGGGSGAQWYNTGGTWAHRKAITISHTQVSGSASLTNYPMLFSVTDPNLKTVANGGSVGKTDGSDILFTAADGLTKLNHEIELYNGTTGQLVAWVQIPTLSPTADTPLYIYYGNASASNQQNATAVWDSNYKLVMHLNDSSGTVHDSTSNANNGTANSGATYTASGLAAGAYNFNGSGGLVTVPNNASWAGNYSGFTMEVWVKAANFPDYTGFLTVGDWNGTLSLWSYNNTYTAFVITTSYGYCESPASTVPYSNTAFTFLAATFDGTVMTPFVNGTQANQFPPSCPGTMQLGTAPLELGGFQTQKFLPGTLDEVRISAAPRSAGWLATEYNNITSPGTFYTVGGSQP
jgi:Concanavalin A-like lectin/glucanases superfamily/Domain of unknown function (DUF2341)